MKLDGREAFSRAGEAARGRDAGRTVVRVCRGGGCRGGAAVAAAIESTAREAGTVLAVRSAGCHGCCDLGPVVTVPAAGLFLAGVKPADAPEIVTKVIGAGEVPDRLAVKDAATKKRFAREAEIPFLAGQTRIGLRNAGRIDPADLDDAIAAGTYGAAAKALTTMTPEQVIAVIEASGLRGRGGAGFSTGLKWRACREATGDDRFAVANGTVLLEIDPHAVLEGLLIAAYAVGAHEGFVFARADSARAVALVKGAIETATARGLLGERILGTDFSFTVRLALGGSEFVCGESTAVLRAIEGLVPEPRVKYPRSAERGLFGRPTVLDNSETLALVPVVVARGPEEFRKVGTAESPGTKVLNLGGRVRQGGLFEVPFGTTLRTLVFGLGGGVAGKRRFKAAMVGGPSGGILGEADLDTPLDYGPLAARGAIVGSGNVMVMDDHSCPVDVARYFTHSLAAESCGKCVPCREGLHHLAEILTRITLGEGTPADLPRLRALARVVADASLCGLGKTAPNVVLSTLDRFEAEYRAHVEDRKCPGGVCRALTKFEIDTDLCEGCQACQKVCPTGAISGAKKQPHRIDPEICTACGMCRTKCKFDAITVV
ncbi:MAG: 4Fe-4S binding protein [Planctomycetes bacterium]|jgi:NADH-quinone oxidoreductase subunit F|nr:4Fe-4S binding protein [Planctomycetota bacterium]